MSVVKSNRFGRAKGEVEEQRRKQQVEVPKRRRRIPAHKKKEKKAPYFVSCVIVTSILSWPDGSQRIRFERVGVALRLTKRRRTRLLSYLVGARSTSLHERKKPPPKKNVVLCFSLSLSVRNFTAFDGSAQLTNHNCNVTAAPTSKARAHKRLIPSPSIHFYDDAQATGCHTRASTAQHVHVSTTDASFEETHKDAETQ